MKIVFTGGGTGGDFYPIIAVVQRVNQIIDHENIIGAKLYFFSNDPYDKEALFESGLIYEEIFSGKRYSSFSVKNFANIFKVILGVIGAIFKLFIIYPDVVFSKGGPAAYPTVFAARILRIPVVVLESNLIPEKVNRWSGGFAKKVAVSFDETAEFFPKKKVAWVGHPIRMELEHPTVKAEALKFFKLESNLPVLLVIGGTEGSELINNIVLDALPDLLKKYQIIHQTGVMDYKGTLGRVDILLENNQDRVRYMPFAFLNPLQMKMAAGSASVVISRASSVIFEIASWGLPSIIVPITDDKSDQQMKNAFTYARAGACIVVEEMNMKANILIEEIDRIINDKIEYAKLQSGARGFHKPDAATKIARELVNITLSHEG